MNRHAAQADVGYKCTSLDWNEEKTKVDKPLDEYPLTDMTNNKLCMLHSCMKIWIAMPSTRDLLATNHSLAVYLGFVFQVCDPNHLLCFTGSLAFCSILSSA